MDEDKLKPNSLSHQEELSLEESFKALNIAFKNSAMYFKTHPYFLKGIEDLKRKLDKNAQFSKILDIEITQDDILFNGKSFKKNSLTFSDLVQFLHRRKIKRIKINTAVSIQDLSDFVFKVYSFSGKERQDSKSLSESLSGIQGIEIEELDYSYLLASRGKHSKEVWNALLDHSTLHTPDQEILDYVLANSQDILDEISSEKQILEDVFSNFDKISDLTESFPKESLESFSKGIVKSLIRVSPEFLDSFSDKDKYVRIKETLSKYLQKDSFLKDIAKDIFTTRHFKPVFLNIYNILSKEEQSEESLADQISGILDNEEFRTDKEKNIASIKDLFTAYSDSKFISRLYKNTLSILSDNILESGDQNKLISYDLEDLTEERINYDYFYTLLELLRSEDDLSDLKLIIAKIDEIVLALVKPGRVKIVKDLIELLDEKALKSEYYAIKEVLNNFNRKLCSNNNINLIVESASSDEDFENAIFILKRIKDSRANILDMFSREQNEQDHEKIIKILRNLADDSAIGVFRDFLSKKSNIFILAQIIGILAQIKTRNSLILLEEIYNSNRKNKVICIEVLKAMCLNPLKHKDFILPILEESDNSLRREAFFYFMGCGEDSEKKKIIEKFVNRGFLGMNDRKVYANIKILSEINTEQAFPWLERLIFERPFFFWLRNESLRFMSFEAMSKISPEKAKELASRLSEDKNPKIRNLALKLMKNI